VAELVVEGDELVVRLSGGEKALAFHGDVRVPLASVRAVRLPDDPYTGLRGWRSTGCAWPGYIAMGKRRHGAGWDFTVIFKHRPTVVVECNGAEFGEIALSVDDAAATATRVAAAAGITGPPAR
jgi:hypothetical protein